MAKYIIVVGHHWPYAVSGYIYEAHDKVLGKAVALKIEKKDKSKNILKFEFQVLNHLKGKRLSLLFGFCCNPFMAV